MKEFKRFYFNDNDPNTGYYLPYEGRYFLLKKVRFSGSEIGTTDLSILLPENVIVYKIPTTVVTTRLTKKNRPLKVYFLQDLDAIPLREPLAQRLN